MVVRCTSHLISAKYTSALFIAYLAYQEEFVVLDLAHLAQELLVELLWQGGFQEVVEVEPIGRAEHLLKPMMLQLEVKEN